MRRCCLAVSSVLILHQGFSFAQHLDSSRKLDSEPLPGWDLPNKLPADEKGARRQDLRLLGLRRIPPLVDKERPNSPVVTSGGNGLVGSGARASWLIISNSITTSARARGSLSAMILRSIRQLASKRATSFWSRGKAKPAFRPMARRSWHSPSPTLPWGSPTPRWWQHPQNEKDNAVSPARLRAIAGVAPFSPAMPHMSTARRADKA